MSIHNINVAVIDMGMDHHQKMWCTHQKNLIIINPNWRQFYLLWDQFSWRWNKPVFFLLSPFRNTLWMDPDCVLLNGVSLLFRHLHEEPVFLCDYLEEPKDDELYELMPVPTLSSVRRYPRTGVVGLSWERDFYILRDWLWCVVCASKDQAIRDAVIDGGDGALGWALMKNFDNHKANDWPEYDFCTEVQYESPADFFSAVRRDFHRMHVVRWPGRKKAWSHWKLPGDILDLHPHKLD